MSSLILSATIIEGTSDVLLTLTNNGNNGLLYTIFRATSPSGPWNVIATISARSKTYIDGNTLPITLYYKFQVVSRNVKKQKDEISESNLASVTPNSRQRGPSFYVQDLGGGTTINQGYDPIFGPNFPI